MIKDFDISSKHFYNILMHDTMFGYAKNKCLKLLLLALKIVILSVFWRKNGLGTKEIKATYKI